MEAKLAPSANLLALPEGTELVGDYRIRRVLGAGGFGITYLADEGALSRLVTIKEYFPAEFAARRDGSAAPRSLGVADDYQWGLDRFIEEAQTLARFNHPNIVRVHRYFRANNTAYMVLHFEEGGNFKAWLRGLNRAPRQAELDRMIAPLLDALDVVHSANYLHRDIAPDNIMVRKDGSPVLIDFGSARGAIASHSRTVSALVKPGYSPYEQYATTTANQGPWTDIYALGATLYHAVAGKRPPDAPSRVVSDEYLPAREAALSSYRANFLEAIDKALRIEVGERPQRIAEWRGALLAPAPARKAGRLDAALEGVRTLGGLRKGKAAQAAAQAQATAPAAVQPASPEAAAATIPASLVPAPPDAPQPKGQLLDFIEALKKHRVPRLAPPAKPKSSKPAARKKSEPASPARVESLAARLPPEPKFGLGYGPAPPSAAAARTGTETAAATETAPKPVPALLLPASRAVASKPRRRRIWRPRLPSRRWRSAIFKVAVAVAVASLAVAYREGAVRPASHSASSGSAVVAAAIAPVMQLSGHQGAVVAVASADDDRWIVSAGADATVRLWSADTGALVRTIELSEGAVTAFAVDGRRALVGHKTGAIVLWDLEVGERLATIQHGNAAITSLAFFGEGFLAARQDGSVALFEAGAQATGVATPAALLHGEEGGGLLIAAAPSRGLFVSGGLDRTVRLWKAPGPQLAHTYRLTDDITAVDIAADGGLVAGGSSGGVVRVWAGPALRSLTSRSVQTLRAHDGRVTATAFGPSGGPPGLLATAGEDGSVKLWSLRPVRALRTLPGGGQVRTLSFARDGRRLFAGGQDGTVRVWSMPQPAAANAI